MEVQYQIAGVLLYIALKVAVTNIFILTMSVK